MNVRPFVIARPGVRERIAVTAGDLWLEYRGPAALGVVVAAGAVATAAIVSVSPPGGFLPEPEQPRPALRTDASTAGRDLPPLVPAGLSPRLVTAGVAPDGGSPAGSVAVDLVLTSLTSGAPVPAGASLSPAGPGAAGSQVVAAPAALSSPGGPPARLEAPAGPQTASGPAAGSAPDGQAQPSPTRTPDSQEPPASARPAPSPSPSPSPAERTAGQPQPSASPSGDDRTHDRSDRRSSDPGDD